MDIFSMVMSVAFFAVALFGASLPLAMRIIFTIACTAQVILQSVFAYKLMEAKTRADVNKFVANVDAYSKMDPNDLFKIVKGMGTSEEE